MSKLNNVIRYLTSKYPHKHELSKTRLTKMVYLSDWYYTQKYNKQITNIEWYFDHYGPYVTDVYETALDDKYLSIEKGFSLYGAPKTTIKINDDYVTAKIKLNKKEIEVLDAVIEDTKDLYWQDFIEKIYSTYPIREGQRYSNLNLVELAEENRKINDK